MYFSNMVITRFYSTWLTWWCLVLELSCFGVYRRWGPHALRLRIIYLGQTQLRIGGGVRSSCAYYDEWGRWILLTPFIACCVAALMNDPLKYYLPTLLLWLVSGQSLVVVKYQSFCGCDMCHVKLRSPFLFIFVSKAIKKSVMQ